MNQQKTRLVMKSIIEYLKSELVTYGWADAASFIFPGYLRKDQTNFPLVGVPVPECRGGSFELGNTNKRGTYFVDIEVKCRNDMELTDLMESIAENVKAGLPIIDFNEAESDDVGYDADAQTIARGNISDSISTRVMDPIENSGRVSFKLRESKPVTV